MSPTPTFRPYPLTTGSHRQTLLGYLCRLGIRWRLSTEDVVVDVESDVRLLLRASWQPGRRADRPALVLVHGLGSSDEAPYILATGIHAWKRGWHVVRVNMRGAGDSETLCPRLYNAGLDGDLVATFRAVALETPRAAVAGFSLGAGLTLLTLGRSAAAIPEAVRGAVAVCPPLDLARCADTFARPRNRLYQSHVMRSLCDSYRRRQRLRPDLYAPGREGGVRTIRDYDEAITAPYAGYRDASEYYERSSAGPYLVCIRRPVLVLAASDDPLIPAESVMTWPLPGCGLVTREVTPTGGHVGFFAPTSAPGRFWAAERAVAFLEGTMGLSPGARGAPAGGAGPRP